MDSNTIDYQPMIQQLFDSYIEFLGETEDTKLETVLDCERDRSSHLQLS